jgi:acyl carrier protein
MNTDPLKLVRTAVARYLAIDCDAVDASHSLESDLGLAPLAVVLVALRLEQDERLAFPIARLEGVRTVAELAAVARAWLSADGRRPQPSKLDVQQNRLRTAATLTVALAVVVAGAVPRNAAAQSGPPQIPEQAFAACESKVEGDSCSIDFRGRELKGTCIKAPSGSRLVCRPNGMPSPPQ